ncbi:MAG: hypothetical protein RIQ31_918 [Actinomycetota bacterium]|jgi:ATP-binding cassette subfamily C protein
MDLGALVVLALAVNVLTADVKNSGTLSPELQAVVNLVLSVTSVSRSNLVFLLAAVVLALFILKAVASALLTAQMNQFLARCETTVTSGLAKRLFAAVTHNGRVPAERASYALTFGTSAMVSRGLGALSTLVSELLSLLVTLSVLVVYQPATTAIAVVYFGVIGMFLTLVFGRKVERFGRMNTEGLNQANSFIKDSLGAQRELFLAGKLGWATGRVSEIKKSAASALGGAIYYSAMPRFVIETALILGAFALAAFEFRFFSLETAVTGLTVFLAGGSRMAPSLLTILAGLATLRQVRSDALVALELQEFLESGQ